MEGMNEWQCLLRTSVLVRKPYADKVKASGILVLCLLPESAAAQSKKYIIVKHTKLDTHVRAVCQL